MDAGRFSANDKTRSQLLQVTTDLTSILESLPLLVISVGRNGEIDHWNAAAERLLGLASKSVKGKNFNECGIDWDWVRLVPLLRASYQNVPTHIDDLRFTRSDRTSGLISITIIWMPDSVHHHSHFLIVGADVTDQKQRDLHSVQSMKLEAIGQLAAGIAHEINTPVQYVGDNVRFLQEAITAYRTIVYDHLALLDQSAKGPIPAEQIARCRQAVEKADLDYLNQEAPHALRSALEGVERIATIVRSLKEFAHPDPGHLTPVDINKALENTLNVARNEYKLVADISQDLDPNLPQVQGFSGELNQVFLNLIVNAAHAIADRVKSDTGRGRITVVTRSAGDYVEIQLGDTGTGIPTAIQARIFEPFFTTKGVGKGTGQGLYLVREIVVKRHHGAITFVTVPDQGTTFFIRLPITEDVPPATQVQLYASQATDPSRR